MRNTAYRGMKELIAEHAVKAESIRARLDEFASVPREEYFYELAYCLLTPQSSAVHAGKVIAMLRQDDFMTRDFDPTPVLRHADHYIRFHNTKARHLREVRAAFPGIAAELSNGHSSPALRAWLVRNVNGLGWKEASHFLRNTGHRNLAILDRHILRNLQKHGVLKGLPTTLTEKRYMQIEQRFLHFADHTGISMDELDLLFWSRETGEILK